MSYTLDQFIENSQGKFITVDFIKKDGTLRTINGRTGVKKYLKGGDCTLDRSKFIIIYENNNGYRAINRDTILAIRCGSLSITLNK
jgi:hypothetical protein